MQVIVAQLNQILSRIIINNNGVEPIDLMTFRQSVGLLTLLLVMRHQKLSYSTPKELRCLNYSRIFISVVAIFPVTYASAMLPLTIR